MKAKTKIMMLAALASFSAVGLIAANAVSKNSLTRIVADTDPNRSFTLTAATIRAALKEDGSATSRKSVDFTYWGLNFHIDNAYYADGKINVSNGVLYNVTFAGQEAVNGMVGTGFYKVEIKGYSAGAGTNVCFQDKEGKNVTGGENALGAVSEDQTVSYSGTTMAARAHIAFGDSEAGTSFTSVTYYYTCGQATPKIDEITGSSTVDKGNTTTLAAKTSYTSENAQYEWTSSNASIATVSGNGTSATVTGVDAGDATITCTLKDGDTTSTKTFAIKVNASEATSKSLVVLDTSKINGAGIFVYFNPTESGMPFGTNVASYCNDDNSGLEVDVKVTEGAYSVARTHFQDQGNTQTTLYVELGSAPSNNPISLSVSLKDTTNNVIYAAEVSFKNDKIVAPVSLTGDSKVLVGSTIELTAEKGVSDEATYAFSSSDEGVATVTSNGNVATVKGVGAGQAAITVTMTCGGKTYTATKTVTVVTEASAAKVLTPTLIKSLTNQVWLTLDNTELKAPTGVTIVSYEIKLEKNGTGGSAPDSIFNKTYTPTSTTFQDSTPASTKLYCTFGETIHTTYDVKVSVDVVLRNSSGDDFSINCWVLGNSERVPSSN